MLSLEAKPCEGSQPVGTWLVGLAMPSGCSSLRLCYQHNFVDSLRLVFAARSSPCKRVVKTGGEKVGGLHSRARLFRFGRALCRVINCWRIFG